MRQQLLPNSSPALPPPPPPPSPLGPEMSTLHFSLSLGLFIEVWFGFFFNAFSVSKGYTEERTKKMKKNSESVQPLPGYVRGG